MDLSTILGEARDLSPECLDYEPLFVSIKRMNDDDVAKKAGKSTRLKKALKKPSDKPKRPLSAYNIFFQHEREKIITGDKDAKLEDVLFKIKNTPKPSKRRHRKSHGMIGFADLARSIAHKWKVLHAAEKAVYEAKAAIEKGKYCGQVCEWERSRETKGAGGMFSGSDAVQDDDEDGDDYPLPIAHPLGKSIATTFQHNQDSLSNLLTGSKNHLNLLQQMADTGDLQNYLSLTERTLSMARASLSLPLFASLPIPQDVPDISDQHNQGPFQGDRFINYGQTVDASYQAYNSLNPTSQTDHSGFLGLSTYSQDYNY